MRKNKRTKNYSIVLLLILFSFILVLNVNAAGVSSPFWDENPMYVQPGEVREFRYLLQNMVGDSNIKVKAELEPGTEIMEFIDENTIYDVPLGKSDIPVNMKIVVPENAKDGDSWQVGVKFTTITEAKEGAVSIGIAYSKGFKVVVGDKASPGSKVVISGTTTKPVLSNEALGFLALVVILVILALIVKYVHKKRKLI